jgi:hypothetical protein
MARGSRETIEEGAAQQRNVLTPLPQRRDFQTQHVEAKIKITSKSSLGGTSEMKLNMSSFAA